MISGDWHDWWPVIYQAVVLNIRNPEKYPLHKNFWGYSRHFGRVPNAPFPERILAAGPNPRLRDVSRAIGLQKANLDGWMRRRVAYIKGLKPDPH